LIDLEVKCLGFHVYKSKVYKKTLVNMQNIYIWSSIDCKSEGVKPPGLKRHY